jgi:hypothetical protein
VDCIVIVLQLLTNFCSASLTQCGVFNRFPLSDFRANDYRLLLLSLSCRIQPTKDSATLGFRKKSVISLALVINFPPAFNGGVLTSKRHSGISKH